MCELISFKLSSTRTGIKVYTAPSLSDHSDIKKGTYEGEWRENGELEVRVPDTVSDNKKAMFEKWVRDNFHSRQKMIDLYIEDWARQGKVGCFEHSKLTDKKKILLSCDYAERVLYIYEKKYPDDKRVRDCINTTRKFANGKVSKEKLDAARADAWAAAGDAAGDAARDAARAAARAAAWAAAWDAAWNAARADARADAWAAARADARADAWAAAGDAEEKWQAEKLLEYISNGHPHKV